MSNRRRCGWAVSLVRPPGASRFDARACPTNTCCREGWGVTERSRSKTVSARGNIVSRISDVPPGSQLPPEPELAAELGVSRSTLREALRSLEDEGLVRRTRGAGTFVAERPRMANNLDANFGVTD